ncbi:MAG: hydroxyacylglutathione hydrolase [Candidatus Sedimenticola sp. PURPLELP]
MLKITPIQAFDDNYIWLLQKPGCSVVAVVDPGDEDPVLDYLRSEGLTLGAVLITHKHGDHTGGVAELKAVYPDAVVFGPANEDIRTVERRVSDCDSIELPEMQVSFQVMELPGHTEGHLAYLGEGVLFCGDTLFAAGCGRVFSGTHEQLHRSLQRIAALPPETQLYCAHEYTLANIGFARWVEPENTAVSEREVDVRALRERDEPTVPSSLELELQTNPFLRTGVAEVIAAASRYAGRELSTGAEVFAAVRTWKDREYD